MLSSHSSTSFLNVFNSLGLLSSLSTEVLLHIVIVILASLLVVVSISAYLRKKWNSRYLFLALAFVCLFASQFVTLIEVVAYSDTLIVIPELGLHVTHVLDLLTLVSFLLAMRKSL
jgi:hypothetical protein